MFSDLPLCSHFGQKFPKFIKISFRFDVGLVGKLEWIFSHIFAQILYRAISEVKCFSLWVICKDVVLILAHFFFSLQVVNS